MMLHTKYQGSWPCGFIQEDVFMFSLYISLCKTRDPQGGVIFRPQEHNLNKFGKGPLDDSIYQLSRLLALWIQTRRFFHVLSRKYFSLCDLDMQMTGIM